MHSRFVTALLFGAVLAASAPAQALQCVPFAREVSGISLRGDAWTWWSAADGVYDRGQAPRAGAVVVFKKHGAMRHGHVAVVSQVVNSREVLVDHANWGSRRTGGRGVVAKHMAVVDISPRNDWTEVRVWNRGSDDYGTRAYPTYGFIYPKNSRSAFVQQASYVPSQPMAPQKLAVPSIAAPTPAVAVVAPPQRLSRPGDAVLATADQQIAAALADAPVLPVKVEVKPLVEARLETKTVVGPAPVAAAPLVEAAPVPQDGSDVALAKRFGSGKY